MPDLQSELLKVSKGNPALRKHLPERIWLWLKDHPGKSASHTAVSLHEPKQAVFAAVQKLVKSEKLRFTEDLGPRQNSVGRKARLYFAVGDSYEDLRKQRSIKSEKVLQTHAAPQDKPAPKDHEVPQVKPALPSVDSLSLKEAFEYYMKLKAYFEPK